MSAHIKHGLSGYRCGCRCWVCKGAHRWYRERIRKERREAQAQELAQAQARAREAPKHERRYRAIKALALQRKNPSMSWTAATRASGTTPATASRYVGSTVTKPGARYKVAVSDRLVRRKKIVTNTGERYIDVRGSRQAELLDEHRDALRRFSKGDTDALRPFEGQSVGGYVVLTDPDEIEAMMSRGEIRIGGY